MWQSWMKKLLESEILATTKLQLQSKTDLSMGEWISGILGKKTGEQVDRDGSRNRNRSRPSDFNYFVPEFFPPGTDPVRTDRRTSKSKQTWRPKFVSGLPKKRSRTFFSAEKVSPISIFFEITRLDFLNEEQETIFGGIRSNDPWVCDLGVLEIESDSPLAFLLSNYLP